MITLRTEIVEQIKSSKDLKIAIQGALGISHTTMYKYLNCNDSKLANLNVVRMLAKKIGVKESEIVSS